MWGFTPGNTDLFEYFVLFASCIFKSLLFLINKVLIGCRDLGDEQRHVICIQIVSDISKSSLCVISIKQRPKHSVQFHLFPT